MEWNRFAQKAKQASRSGEPQSFETQLRRRNGELFFVLVEMTAARDALHGGKALHAVVVDIDRRMRMEEHEMRAQKFETLGRLARGFAHDLNNLLTVILGSLNLANSLSMPWAERSSYLDEAETGCRRAMEKVRHLMALDAEGSSRRVCAPAATLVESAVSLALSGSRVQCDLVLGEDLPAVECDVADMNLVIANVVSNAIEAMPEGGTICVEVIERCLKPSEGFPLIRAQRCVEVIIRDTGTGIEGRHLSKVFDPCFSTKEGRSGMGLTVAYGILSQHGGHVSVESIPGRGTTVRLYVPAVEHTVTKATPLPVPRLQEGDRVLVMDDEASVRRITGDILKRFGYDVICVCDAQGALDVFREACDENRRFDLVLLDLTIPGGRGGREVIREIRSLDPDIRAVLMSGYSDEPPTDVLQAQGFALFLAKPFSVDNLRDMLSRLE